MRIAILGSGNGTTARAILAYEASRSDCRFRTSVVISTSSNAGICDVARQALVNCVVVTPGADPSDFAERLMDVLQQNQVDLLVLAGFMKLLPVSVIEAMNGRVINVHPALLPKFGGKGMYGRRVHEAVSGSGEVSTGATVHWVNERYDDGAIIAQESVSIEPGESAGSIEEKVKMIEVGLLPRAIEALAENNE